MCLVAFQKIFRKIFSGVWKRRRKTQPRKNSNTVQILPLGSLAGAISRRRDRDQQRDLAVARSRSTARSCRREIAINGAITRRRDRDRRIFLSDLAIFLDGSSSRIARRRDLAKARSRSTARSREGEITIDGSSFRISRSSSTDLPLGSLAGAISRRRDRDQRRDLAVARSRSSHLLSRASALSLSLIFRKCFEGKIEV